MGALFFRPPDAEAPRRTELRRSREALRSSGVCTDRREEGASVLMGRRLGVLAGVLPSRLLLVGLVGVASMFGRGSWPAPDRLGSIVKLQAQD